jgi:hypothetical protein
MGTIEVELKKENAAGRSYTANNVLAALMEHDIGFLFILHSDGEETLQSMDEISNLVVSGIEIQHA